MVAVTDYRALISGSSWYQQELTGKPVILTYSFEAAPASYSLTGDPATASTFASLNVWERQVVRAALQQWSAVSGVEFIETSRHQGDLTFSFYNLDNVAGANVAGLAYFPSSFAYASNGQTRAYAGENLISGDVWFDTGTRARAGSEADFMHLALHEIGHALGLKHPFEAEGTHTETLTAEADRGTNTVMSYDQSVRSSKLGPLDIAAAQHIFGTASAKGSQFANWSFDPVTERFTAQGNASDELLRGTGTDDVIYTGGGRDTVYTAQGNDVIVAQGQSLSVNGGSGTDTVVTGLTLTSLGQIQGTGDARYVVSGGVMQTYLGVERLVFDNGTVALDVQGNAGEVYRLYQAAFARTPDQAGLSHNIRIVDQGLDLHGMAGAFVVSAEFQSCYGANVTDQAFVTALYRNVLNRDPDAIGNADWLQRLGSGQSDRAGVLIGFSESPENHKQVDPSIQAGIHLDYGVFA